MMALLFSVSLSNVRPVVVLVGGNRKMATKLQSFLLIFFFFLNYAVFLNYAESSAACTHPTRLVLYNSGGGIGWLTVLCIWWAGAVTNAGRTRLFGEQHDWCTVQLYDVTGRLGLAGLAWPGVASGAIFFWVLMVLVVLNYCTREEQTWHKLQGDLERLFLFFFITCVSGRMEAVLKKQI